MMRKRIGWLWIGIACGLAAGAAGCASAAKLRALKPGLSGDQVSDRAGNPESIRRQGEQIVWYYRNDEGRCAVVFENERLASLACDSDEAAAGGAVAPGTATEVAVTAASSPPPVFIH